jgi:3-phosphoshikimate 1-carboxyvinyltransferase
LKKLVVEPIPKISGEITLPGSKSLSNRVLLLAALSKGTTKVENLLDSEDIRYMLAALQQLGVPIDEDKAKKTAVVTGRGGTIDVAAKTDLFLGNAGTAMRPLTGVLCAGQGEFVLDGTPRMRERPIVDLIDGLKQLGVDVSCSATGCPPVVIKARGIQGFLSSPCVAPCLHSSPPPRHSNARRRDRHLGADLLAVPVRAADDRPVGHGRRGDAHQGRADVRPVRARDT